jgi:hypothetical protein
MEKVRIVICMMIMIVSVKAYGWKGILGSCCCCDEKEEIEEMGRPLMGGGVVGGVGGIGKIDSRQEGGYQSQNVQEVIGPAARVQEPVIEEIRGNRVIINGEIIKDHIYGGKVKSDRGTVIGNVVEISSASGKKVIGGDVDNGTVRDNVVRISSANVWCVDGGGVNSGEVKNNIVEISSVIVGRVFGGCACKGDASTVVSSNRVRIVGGRVEGGGDVYGGRCLTAGKVEGNEVEIINGDIRKQLLANGDTDGGNICGGSIVGRLSVNTKLVSNNNRVKIVGGRVEGEVGGGNAGIGEGCEGIVSNNEVEIKVGFVGESVYGGKV